MDLFRHIVRKPWNLSVLLWAKKIFQETRKALKVRRTAVGALLVDMPEHICFSVSFFVEHKSKPIIGKRKILPSKGNI